MASMKNINSNNPDEILEDSKSGKNSNSFKKELDARENTKNDDNFLKPTYNSEINRSKNYHLTSQDSPKYSSSSYTTTSSSNKMFYLPNESINKLPNEENLLELSTDFTKLSSKTSLKKSKSFSFERNFNEKKIEENNKKRNFSYFSHQSCKLKFNLEMDFLKKFSITTEDTPAIEKVSKFRKSRHTTKSRKFNDKNEFLIGKTYEFGIMKKDNFKEQKNRSSKTNLFRNFSFNHSLSNQNQRIRKSPRLSHTRNSRKNKPKIVLTTTKSKEQLSDGSYLQIKKSLNDLDCDLIQKTPRSRASSMNTLSSTLAAYKLFVNKREKHITYKLGAILFAFMISWTPWTLAWTLVSFCPRCVPQSAYIFSFWLAYSNSIFTPLILLYNNSKYRRSLTFFKILFIKIFCCFYKNENLNFHNSSYYVTHKFESNTRINNLSRNVNNSLSLSQKRTSNF